MVVFQSYFVILDSPDPVLKKMTSEGYVRVRDKSEGVNIRRSHIRQKTQTTTKKSESEFLFNSPGTRKQLLVSDTRG